MSGLAMIMLKIEDEVASDILDEHLLDNFDPLVSLEPTVKMDLSDLTTNDKEIEDSKICQGDLFQDPRGDEFHYRVKTGPVFEEEDSEIFEKNPTRIQVEEVEETPSKVITKSVQSPQTRAVIDAGALLSKFPDIKFEVKKATNAPKFLYKTFYDGIENELAGDHDGDSHLEWLRRYHESHNSQKTKTRFELIDLFGEAKSDKKERRSRIRRTILQRKLANQKVELIMNNNMIPPNNKLHYMYFTKIYEWRLNLASLTGRFN